MTTAPARWHFMPGSRGNASLVDRRICHAFPFMKVLSKFINQRIAEALSTGDELQELFTLKIPGKGFSEKWLLKSLHKRGPRLLTARAWLHPVAESRPPSTIGDLAAHLSMSVSELKWFADLHQRNPYQGPLHHYRYRWIPRKKGAPRLLMEPKESLKLTQRRILETILDNIPLHEAAHGFVRGRSIETFAKTHIKQRTVLRMDLADFFPSISFSRIAGVFRTFAYLPQVAHLLAGLCTHQPPRALARMNRHLPQGAPTSPALANITAYPLDCRLSGLAKSQGLNFTRYADDLVFSGPHISQSFAHLVGGIALEEGFSINHRKTRFMKSSTQQRIAGVVVNEHPNIDRREFDRLKAILHNCAQHGPESQGMADQSRHLRGKISFVQMLNPQRGEKLLKIYESIKWE